MARSFGSVRLIRANSLPARAGVAMMSAISVLQNTTLPAPIIAIFFPIVFPFLLVQPYAAAFQCCG